MQTTATIKAFPYREPDWSIDANGIGYASFDLKYYTYRHEVFTAINEWMRQRQITPKNIINVHQVKDSIEVIFSRKR